MTSVMAMMHVYGVADGGYVICNRVNSSDITDCPILSLIMLDYHDYSRLVNGKTGLDVKFLVQM